MPRHTLLTDRQWDRTRPLLPSSTGRRGRPWDDHRRIVEACVYQYRTGILWRDLPARFGSWKTVWARHRRWAADGTWDRVLGVLLARANNDGPIDWRVAGGGGLHHHPGPPARHQHPPPEKCRAAARGQGLDAHREPPGHAIGHSRGGLTTKIHHAVDGHGRPLVVVVTPGQAHDSQVPAVAAGRPTCPAHRRRPTPHEADLRFPLGILLPRHPGWPHKATIPEHSDQVANRRRRGSRGGRRPAGSNSSGPSQPASTNPPPATGRDCTSARSSSGSATPHRDQALSATWVGPRKPSA
ncbi:IS5 family transposase [Streptomyces sp. JV184]|uniref:IS5 family transposase n=1 Tax=Streptomyces sp. JV184 TaxID=858637 RepID=UPI003FA7B93C